jgi:hypothetical protein
MAKGFVYLVAVMDWFSRRVLSWRLSIGLETVFCIEAWAEAMERYGPPEIFNTDQGVQFKSAEFVGALEARGVWVSMDGRGRFLDNIFIERLWRSLKYEEVFIKAYGSVAEARREIGWWLGFYNDKRLLVLYDVSLSYFEGRCCPPARHGHSRDHRSDRPQIVYGLLCTREGLPVAVEVFDGNTADPSTASHQVKTLKDRFGLSRVVLVGDHGMITSARIEEDLKPAGLDWITCLRAPATQALAAEGGPL